MKKLVSGLLASLLLSSALPAVAGPWEYERHSRPDRHYAPPAARHHHPRHSSHAPIVWGLAGVALGTVLYNLATPPAVAAPSVVYAPPQPIARNVLYYCEPYQAYYPNEQACPEPWRVIPGW